MLDAPPVENLRQLSELACLSVASRRRGNHRANYMNPHGHIHTDQMRRIPVCDEY